MPKLIKPLKGKKKIEEVYKFGKKYYTENISSLIVFDFNNEDFPLELAVTVRKKINRKAVTRNRIKRLLRESLRQLAKELQESNTANTVNSIKHMILYWRHEVEQPKCLKLDKVKLEVAAILEKASNFSIRYQKEKLSEINSADNNKAL